MNGDIDFYAPHGAPDNDRKMKEASWLCSQAFIESLRVYPDPVNRRPVALPGLQTWYDRSFAFDVEVTRERSSRQVLTCAPTTSQVSENRTST